MIKVLDDHERTLAFAEVALGQIKSLRQTAIPRNYEIWDVYATGDNLPLNKIINETLARNGKLTGSSPTTKHPTMIYCEGYVLLEKVPMLIEHAWCIDEAGSVVDNTVRSTTIACFGIPSTELGLHPDPKAVQARWSINC